MTYNLTVDGKETDCTIKDNSLIFGGTSGTTVDVLDIINVEKDNSSCFKLHIINKSKNPKWRRSVLRVAGDIDVCNKLICEIKDLMKQASLMKTYGYKMFALEKMLKKPEVSPKPRQFLVMINPVGGTHLGLKTYQDIVAPIFNLAGITTEVIVSERPKHVMDVVSSYEFSHTDGIVLCGGDGTYHECFATLLRRFQNEVGIDVNDINAPIKSLPFPVAMIPTGTGNLIARTNYGTDDVETAALHIVRGQIKKRCVCSYFEYGKLLTYAGQSFAYGDLAEMLYKMNKTRGFMGIKRMFILLYYFLLKRLKQFQVEIEFIIKHEETNSESEQDTTDQDVEIREHPGVLKGNYFHVSSLIDDLTDEEFRYNPRLRDTYSTSLSLFKPCGRLDFMTHFKGLVQNTEDTFQRDFIHNEKFTWFKFKLLDDGQGQGSNTDGQRRFIAVDGETVEISGTEFECKWHKDIIPVYSSF